jgi:hypothetical protein
MTESPRPPEAVWAAEPPLERRDPLIPPRQLRKFALAAAAVAAIGAFAGLLAWYRPLVAPYFVPLWITQYRSPAVPHPEATENDREAIRTSGIFPRGPDAYGSQEGLLILRELGLLGRLPASERVVVFLSGYALDRVDGGIDFLPADADPVRGQGAISLVGLLRLVKQSPPRAKLLVLDLARPWTDPRVGALRADVAARLPELVRQVEEEHRLAGGSARPDWLVLLSCAPGQLAHDAPAFGRTGFGLFFEEGLRGAAMTGTNSRPREGRVSVRNLAEYLSARVDAWARTTHGTRQTPILIGDGPDFDLAAAGLHPATGPEPAQYEPYPAWLADGWQTLADWRTDGTLAASPRLVQELQATLLGADASRAGGTADGWIAGQLKFSMGRLAARRKEALAAPPRPARPASLALAARFGAVKDPAVERAAATMLNAWRSAPSPKPEERDAVMTKLAQTFLAAAAKATPFAIEEAVFSQAADAASRSDLLALLDRVFQERRQPVAFVETRFLCRLAAAAKQAGDVWPGDLGRAAVTAVARTEEACARPDLWPWAGPVLETCAEARWNGEILLTDWGMVAPDDLTRRFQDAARQAEALLVFANVLDAGRRATDESLVGMLSAADYLDEEPSRAAAWDARLRATADLVPALQPPARPAGTQSDLLGLTDSLRNRSEGLRQMLTDFREEVWDSGSTWALAAADRDNTAPAAGRRFEALLRLPALPPPRRAALSAARAALAARLAEARPVDAEAPSFGVAATDAARQEEDRRASRLAKCHQAILGLAQVAPETLAKLEQLRIRADREGPNSKAWPELADGLRHAWSDGLNDALIQAPPGRRDTIAALFPGYEPNPALDTPPGGPRVAQRSAVWGEFFAWLASRYRYAARAGLDSTVLDDAAADADAGATVVARYPVLTVQAPAEAVSLSLERPAVEVLLRVVQTGPGTGTPQVRALVPNAAVQVTVDEGSLHMTSSPADGGRAGTVRLRVERAADVIALPSGFVVEVRLGGRSAFARLPLAASGTAAAVELVIDRVPTDPGGLGDDIHVRPAEAGQPLYVFVRNRTAQPRQAVVRIAGPAGPVPGGEAKIGVNPGETKLVPFAAAPAPAAAGGPAAFNLPATLRLEADDAAKPGELLRSRSVRLDVANPAEYVELSDAQFEPRDPPSRPVNRLRVTLRARRDLGAVPCFAELVLDPRAVPGLRGVRAGRLRGQIPANGTPLVLDAEGLDLDPEAAETGTAYVTVDGVERAFRLRVVFARSGDPTTPALDNSPRLNLSLRPAPRVGRSVAFTVGTDQAPPGSTLDVRLLRSDPDGGTHAEQTDKFPAPRQRRATIAIGSGGAIVVTAGVSDWDVTWDLPQLLGRRTLEARLRLGGEVLRVANIPLILDDTPPTVTFRDVSRQAKRGEPLSLRVDAADAESGVASVQFYVGKPGADGKPPPGADLVPGVRSGEEAWTARLSFPPDKRGPTDVSVRAVNGAGLAASATTSVDLVDSLPIPPGAVAGRLLEGDRPQAGLEVRLTDEKGAVLQRTTTDADGKYRFADVAPGRYRLSARKPANGRMASGAATVDAGKTATVDLPLFL